jgi:hypothetical protein
MSDFKTWFIEVFVKKLGPSFTRAALTSAGVFFAAHAGILTKYGVTYDSTNQILSEDLKILSAALFVLVPPLITAVFALIQHHTVAAINGTPQSGAHVPSGGLSTPPPTGA